MDSELTGREPSLFDGEILLGNIASALVQLSRRRVPSEPVYPDVVQSAYNQLALLCLRRGDTPPANVPDMARWAARKPLGDWPLELPDDVATSVGYLVDRETGAPTQDCYEWEVSAPDPAAEQLENRVIEDVLATCRAADSPESYTAFRRLMIERPVLTGTDLALLGADIDLGLLQEPIKRSYERASAALLRDGSYHQCPRCHSLLVPVADGFRCELDRCRRDGQPTAGKLLDPRVDGGIYQLSRPLRMFITGPGLAETELETEFWRLGLEVEMWPHFDTYDVRVTFPGGQVWAIDVKDRANPALLARSTEPFPAQPSHNHAFLVVPQYRLTEREDYIRVFDHHRSGAAGQLELLSDQQLLSRAASELRATRRRKGTGDA